MPDFKSIYIHSAAALGPHGDLSPDGRGILKGDAEKIDLGVLMGRFKAPELRRASHFSKLALIAISEAIERAPSPVGEGTPLYFSTGLGEEQGTVDLFENIMEGRVEATSPFAFVNSVNNTTAFFLSKINGLNGQSLIISQEDFSFECALSQACCGISLGESSHALVGGADEFCRPRKDHMTRISLRDDQKAGEGSGWLYIGRERGNAVGEIVMLKELNNREADFTALICNIIAPYLSTNEKVRLLPGFRLRHEDVSALIKEMPKLEVTNYLELCGAFHTSSAFGMASIFDKAEEGPLLYFHVNRNLYGRTFIAAIRVFGQRG